MINRVNSYDYLRVFTTYTVVLLHTAAPFLYLYDNIPINTWMIGNTFDSIVRWCVPVFFMLSGAFLLDPSKNDTIIDFFRKRLNKVLIPFIVWTLVYYFYSVFKHNKENSIEVFIRGFLNNDISNHLWFIYILIGLYIITPILRILINNLSREMLLYFLIVWFVGNSLFDLINFLFEVNIYLDIPIDDYLGFFILGYFIRTQTISNKITKAVYVLAFFSLLLTILGTYFETVSAGKFVEFYYEYLSPNTVIVALAVFIFFKNFNPSNHFFSKVVNFFNKRSFGIYLIHILILNILSDFFGVNATSYNPLISIPVISMMTFLLSSISIFILQKIPLINKIVT